MKHDETFGGWRDRPTKNLWNDDGWKWPESGPWFNSAGSVGKLDRELMRRVVPTALHGRGRLVPLCGLNNTNLVELVMEPALELVKGVPLA